MKENVDGVCLLAGESYNTISFVTLLMMKIVVNLVLKYYLHKMKRVEEGEGKG